MAEEGHDQAHLMGHLVGMNLWEVLPQQVHLQLLKVHLLTLPIKT